MVITQHGRIWATAIVCAAVPALAGCGSSSSSTTRAAATASPSAPEVNPAGDIPDNQVYVAYRRPGAAYSVKVPEGWSQTSSGGVVTFTDKLNSISAEQHPAASRLTVGAAKAIELPRLAKSARGFKPRSVTVVKRPAGAAIRIAYLTDSTPDAVTGRSTVDAVERYVFFHGGRRVVLTLSGPKGADNVDPWKLVSSSLRWTR